MHILIRVLPTPLKCTAKILKEFVGNLLFEILYEKKCRIKELKGKDQYRTLGRSSEACGGSVQNPKRKSKLQYFAKSAQNPKKY